MSDSAADQHAITGGVLVTGGAGFIGSHLAESLVAAGAQVTVLDNLRAGSMANLAAIAGRIELVEADVRHFEAVVDVVQRVRPRYVFHLAANPSIPYSVRNPAADYDSNVLGTVRVLEAVRSVATVERFILASTGAVYGEPERVPINEAAPLRPISPYGAGKVAAERVAIAYYRNSGVPCVVARMFNAYGPRMGAFVVRDLYDKLRADPTALRLLGSGSQVRDFTYVDDAVAGLLCLASHGAPGEHYNVASGAACSVNSLAADLIAACGLGGTTRVEHGGESWPGDAQRWEVDLSKISVLGYTARISLAEGLRRTVAWFGSQPSHHHAEG